MANFIAGVWLDYRRIMGELRKDYVKIMEILLLNYSSVAVILEHAGTGLELGTSWNPAVGSSESNSCQLEKVSRPGIEPVTASGSNSQAPQSCSDRESNSDHMEICSRTGFTARVAIIFR